jgi:hypothetical protein
METTNMNIIPYEPPMRQAALDLALRAWEPVFPQLKAAVPGFVYGAFYPEEWQKRQLSDLGQILDNEPHTVDVAMLQDQNGSETPQLAGWVCTRIHQKTPWVRCIFWPSTHNFNAAASATPS